MQNKNNKWLRRASGLIATLMVTMSFVGNASARILFQDDLLHDIDSEGILINADGTAGVDQATISVDGSGDVTFEADGDDISFGDNNLSTTGDLDVDGVVDFSNASEVHFREVATLINGTTSCTTVGEIIVDLATDALYICTDAATNQWKSADNNPAVGTSEGNTLRWDNTAGEWVESNVISNDGTDVTINTSTWDISSAGAASGFTTFTGSGDITTTGGDIVIGTTGLNDTTSGASGAGLIGAFDEFDNTNATNVQDILDDFDAAITSNAVSDDFEAIFATDSDNTLTTSDADFTVNTGLGDFIVNSTNWDIDAAGDADFNSVSINGIGLEDNSTTNSGASLVGLFDNSFTNIAANTTMQVAIGELDTAIGNLSTLTTTAQGSAVAAINELDSDLGDLQTEVDGIETAMGTVIDANGDYVAHSGTNYIDGNTNLTTDLTDLDAAIAASAAFNIADGTAANNTLRWDGSDWVQSTSLTNDGTDVDASGDFTANGDVTTTTGDIIIGTTGLSDTAAGASGAGLVGFDNANSANLSSTTTQAAIDEMVTDLGSTASGDGAALVGIFDTAGNFTATDVEGALAELASDAGAEVETLRFYPEYANAVYNGERGKLTSEDDATEGHFYSWTTRNNSDQEMEIKTSFELPSDFDNVNDLTLRYSTATANTANNSVLVSLSANGTTCGTTSAAASASWATMSILEGAIEAGCAALTAGDIIEISITMLANDTSNGEAYIGYVDLDYDN